MEKKILLVGWGYPPNIDGGLDVHVAELFKELLEAGVDVNLVLPEERAPDREQVISVNSGDGSMVQKARNISQEVAKLAKDYDIVHTHDWFGAESGFKAQKYSDVNWITTFHSLSSGRNRDPSEELKRFEKVAAENSDEVIAVSEVLAEEIESEFDREPKVIHNGFSKPESSGIDVKKKLGIDGDMVFFVGRHSEQKGIEHLLYGFKKLLEDREADLVIGGDGHMTDSLQKFAELLGIEDRAHFVGFVPDRELGDYYESADVFVSPSINEPFGLTITEALECGTTVVATRNGVEEIKGNSVISIEPNSDSIKEGIEKGLEKNSEVNFSDRSWQEVAEETIKLYEKL